MRNFAHMPAPEGLNPLSLARYCILSDAGSPYITPSPDPVALVEQALAWTILHSDPHQAAAIAMLSTVEQRAIALTTLPDTADLDRVDSYMRQAIAAIEASRHVDRPSSGDPPKN